jgi:hypothetical protein
MIGMEMTDQDINEIELDIKKAKVLVDRGESLNRLLTNKDFILLISEGYFKEHAYQLIELKAAPSMHGKDKQEDILRSIDGIGALQQYFNSVDLIAKNASQAIFMAHEELDEIDSHSGGLR